MESYQALYAQYEDSNVVAKARDYARYTLPYICAQSAQSGDGRRQQLERDYQSVGAFLISNVSAKLAEALFPSNRRMVRVDIKGEHRSRASSIDSALLAIETELVKIARANGGYAQLIECIQHLYVTGQCCLRRLSGGGYLVYGLNSFVTRRDSYGTVVDAVIREYIDYSQIPEDIREANNLKDNLKPWELYTRVHHVGEIVQVIQKLADRGSIIGTAEYPIKGCPFIFPTLHLSSGEHYARGEVETYAGDFQRLSNLSEAGVLYEVEALKVLHITRGAGPAIEDLRSAGCGEFIELPQQTEVEAYEGGDYNKLAQVNAEVNSIIQRLYQAFAYAGSQRDAERVTAEEVRRVATEADRSSASAYSILGKTLQIPLAYVLLEEMDSQLFQGVAGGSISLDVSAGLDALGRTIESQQLMQALSESGNALVAVQNINQVSGGILDPIKIMQQIFTANGVELDDYTKPKEQLQQEQTANANVNLAMADPNLQGALGA